MSVRTWHRGAEFATPISGGTFRPRPPEISTFVRAPIEWRDMVVMWSKDLGRTLDFLETRHDIDHQNVAYYRFSSGADCGPVFAAVEPRV